MRPGENRRNGWRDRVIVDRRRCGYGILNRSYKNFFFFSLYFRPKYVLTWRGGYDNIIVAHDLTIYYVTYHVDENTTGLRFKIVWCITNI